MAIEKVATLAVDVVVTSRRALSTLNSLNRTLIGGVGAARGLTTAFLGFTAAASAISLVSRGIETIVSVTKASVLAFAELEDAIISINVLQRSTDINELAESFLDLGTSAGGRSFKVLADSMREAARAGFKTQEELAKITDISTKFAIVSQDISATQATRDLARLAINTKTAKDDILNLASSIDILSDKFTITSGEILTSTSRLSGLSEVLGINVTDLAGVVAALQATGATGTTVRSTLVRLFQVMQTEPEKVKNALNLSFEEFTRFETFLRESPNDALLQIIEKLSALNAQEQLNFLKELQIANARTAQNVLIFSANIDKVKEAQALANEEFRSGANLLEKFAEKQQSVSSQLTLITNRFEKFKATLIESDLAVNLLFGSMTALEGAFGKKFEIDIFSSGTNPVAVAKNIQELDLRLRLLKDEAKKIADEKAILFPAQAVKATRLTLLVGEIQKLERLRALLIETLEAFQNLKEKAEEAEIPIPEVPPGKFEFKFRFSDLGVNDTPFTALGELAKTQAILGQEAFDKVLPILPLEEFEKSVIALTNNFNDFLDEFPIIRENFDQLDLAVELFERALLDLTLKRIDEKRKEREREEEETRSLLLSGIGGKASEALSIIDRFDKILTKTTELFPEELRFDPKALEEILSSPLHRDSGISIEDAVALAIERGGVLDDPFKKIFDLEIDALTDKDDEAKIDFKGLTQAWRDAQNDIARRDDRLKAAYFDAALEFVKFSKTDTIKKEEMTSILKMISEKLDGDPTIR